MFAAKPKIVVMIRMSLTAVRLFNALSPGYRSQGDRLRRNHANYRQSNPGEISNASDGSPKTVQFSGTCDVSESHSQRVIRKGNIQFHLQ